MEQQDTKTVEISWSTLELAAMEVGLVNLLNTFMAFSHSECEVEHSIRSALRKLTQIKKLMREAMN